MNCAAFDNTEATRADGAATANHSSGIVARVSMPEFPPFAARGLAHTFQRVEPNTRFKPYGGAPGVNHLAYVVDDVEALRGRLAAAGYKDSAPPNAHPFRTRQYFYDSEGNDWEFVQYRSTDPVERNDYKLSDR